MNTSRAVLLIVVVALFAQGCAIIDYRPDPERATYLAAKTAVYGLYRAGTPKDRLIACKPHLEALAVVLEANDEVTLDATLAEYLNRYAARLPVEGDRELVGELVAATLAAFRLQNPALLSDMRRERILWVIGGMIDGIAYIEEVAKPNG